MVGVGGGVPSQKDDIRLGDVVISKPGVKHGGVVQYDYGKTVQGGKFEQTGVLNQPPQVLLTRLNQLEANRKTSSDGSVLEIISKVLERYPDMKGQFSPPEEHTDILFDSSYYHLDKESNCANCDKERLVKRQPRDKKEPFIHCGLIASGNQVMKDAETRDRLAHEQGILCFEMEAAGIMNELPTTNTCCQRYLRLLRLAQAETVAGVCSFDGSRICKTITLRRACSNCYGCTVKTWFVQIFFPYESAYEVR
jgi:nucleoside phosphorylase